MEKSLELNQLRESSTAFLTTRKVQEFCNRQLVSLESDLGTKLLWRKHFVKKAFHYHCLDSKYVALKRIVTNKYTTLGWTYTASYTVFTNGGHAGKKKVPSHESEALDDKQKLQMKTFSELAECLARILPKLTLYRLLFKYNYVGCLLLLMFSSDLLFAIKREAYIFKKTQWFCRFPKHQKLGKWTMAGEKRQTCWPKLHTETEYESQVTTIL